MDAKSRQSAINAAFLAANILASAGCTPHAADGSLSTADASDPAAPGRTSISQILQTKSEFTDFRDVIKFAGLWDELDRPQGLTVLAPTNVAFDHSDPNWRANTQPDIAGQGNRNLLRRQTLIETAEIEGIHPPSDFVGKLQDVRSVGGAILHIDGRIPGVFKLSTGPVSPARFGVVPLHSSANISLPPLQASNGLIYSIDSITVRGRN